VINSRIIIVLCNEAHGTLSGGETETVPPVY
jgi:hypothetical protein